MITLWLAYFIDSEKSSNYFLFTEYKVIANDSIRRDNLITMMKSTDSDVGNKLRSLEKKNDLSAFAARLEQELRREVGGCCQKSKFKEHLYDGSG